MFRGLFTCLATAVLFGAFVNEGRAQFGNTPLDPKTWSPGHWFKPDEGGYTDSWVIEGGGTSSPPVFLRFTNRASHDVLFLVTGDAQYQRLAPGRTITTQRRPGGLTIKLVQPGNGIRSFTLPASGRYAFIARNGQILNAFD